MLELDYFRRHPERSWPILKEIFYDQFAAARPNRAHEVLAAWEARGWPRGADHSAAGAGPDGRGGPSGAASDALGLPERGLLKVLITQNVDSVQLN